MFNPEEWFQGEQVVAGAAVLDEKLPGWELMVDLGTLNLNSCSSCILGQTFGDYWTAGVVAPEEYREGHTLHRHFADDTFETTESFAGPKLQFHWSVNHGFMFDGDDEDFEALTETWRAFIKDRFDSGTQV